MMISFVVVSSLMVVATMAGNKDLFTSGFDYCTLNAKCTGGQQTMCKYKSDTPGKNCLQYEDHLLSVQDKKDMLKKHNELRALLQTGTVKGHPAAKIMPALTWSSEMEQIARRWAFQCTFEHDKCRHSKDGISNGQNLAINGKTGSFRGVHLNAVQDWFDEYKLYTPTGKNLLRDDLLHEIGHYTQVVAARSTHVGCERTYFNYKGMAFNSELTVCVYHPSGNVGGKEVYDMLPPGKAGQLSAGAAPLPGETGVPGQTALSGRAPTVKQQNCIAVLLVCLIFALQSAIFTEDF